MSPMRLLVLCALCFALLGCFSLGGSPKKTVVHNKDGSVTEVEIPLTPFQTDLYELFTPVVWVCFLGGAALIGLGAASISLFSFLSARTSFASGVAGILLGLTLLWVRNFLVAHTWIIPCVALAAVGVFVWPFVHRLIVKWQAKGAPDLSTARDQLKALVGLPSAVPTLTNPTGVKT